MHRDLLDCGLRFVMLDIDNTLVARDTNEVPHDVGMWLARARDAGIGFCLLSNNWHRSVLELAERLELPIVAKAMKPLPMGYLRASRLLDAPREATVVVGDQLGTDVFGAHMIGMRAYLVAPLCEQDLPHMLVMRRLEGMVMSGRLPEGASGAAPYRSEV